MMWPVWPFGDVAAAAEHALLPAGRAEDGWGRSAVQCSAVQYSAVDGGVNYRPFGIYVEIRCDLLAVNRTGLSERCYTCVPTSTSTQEPSEPVDRATPLHISGSTVS
jgi:hypothetical protein